MTDVTLVTGASGFVGAQLLERFRGTGVEAEGWTRTTGDLGDQDTVKAILRDLKPTRIFHLAASKPDDGHQSWHQVATEQRMLENLARAMPDHCRLLYTGSMAEYGHAGTLDEFDPCHPDTAYGCAKYACTTLAQALRGSLDKDIRVARLFGIFGPGEQAKRLLPSLVRSLSEGVSVDLSDGTQIRDFVHVGDATCALVALMDGDYRHPVINVGTGVGVSVRAVCEAVAEALGADAGLLRFGVHPRRSVDQDKLVARVDRLQEVAGVPPQRWNDQAEVDAIVAEFLALQ